MSQESFVGEIDPITLEVINESFVAVVREMRANMVRTAYSSIIYEGHDFSCVLVDGTGQLVAMAEDNPVHIFPVPMEVGEMLERFGGDIHPGDVFIHNDPYTGGTHLNDVAIISPLFHGERMAVYPVVRAHWGDVGGTTPGSISGKNTEILHDGVRIPILRIIEKGELNEGLLELLLHNMRVPEERRGDFFAMLATCHTAHKRLEELAAKYGWSAILAAKDRLLDRAEASMRRRIAALPDGESIYEHFMDHDGHSLTPIRIRVRVEKTGDELIIDFHGTDPQTKGAYNVGPAMAPSAAFSVIKAFLDPKGAINHGAFRPLHIRVESGSLLSARYPASCAGSMEVSHAVVSALIGATARFASDVVTGDLKGTSNHVYIGGRDARNGKPFLFYEFPAGGTGGFQESDGNSAMRNFTEGDFASIQPVEVIEQGQPLKIRELSLRADSGGAGVQRGGLGLRREVEVLAESALLSISSDKNVIPPFGVLGGGPGKPNRFGVARGGETLAPSETPGKAAGFPLEKGDVFVMETSGGGGFGDPFQRDTESVLADVRAGYVTEAGARKDYAVIVRDGVLDEEATRANRQAARAARRALTLVLAGEDAQEDSRRRCYMNPAALAKRNLERGDLVELRGKWGVPLRAWVEEDEGLTDNAVGLAADGVAILDAEEDDAVFLSPVSV
ncbi:MAG: hydantoinase B/oxoprolinase family protein [Nitrospinae bacterium]|nr:hydantoinase B/oxoprolinase family protein [Nitrospinota bacterium]